MYFRTLSCFIKFFAAIQNTLTFQDICTEHTIHNFTSCAPYSQVLIQRWGYWVCRTIEPSLNIARRTTVPDSKIHEKLLMYSHTFTGNTIFNMVSHLTSRHCILSISHLRFASPREKCVFLVFEKLWFMKFSFSI